MFAIRVYLALLTLAFLLSMLLTNQLGILAAIVGICSLLYLIFDTREELQRLKLLEAQVSAFLTSLA
jgi:4-hydroxybenzoate polyprenyltransferase